MPSAYPAGSVKVVDFKYKSSLCLMRKIAAVRGRKEEDAEYVVARFCFADAIVQTAAGSVAIPIRVPAGFLTDLSSIPWFLRCIVSRAGPHLEASIVHDWLYIAWQVEGISPTSSMRHFADGVFLAAMKVARVRCYKRWLIYLAVKVFGWCAFYGRDERIFADPPWLT